MEPRSSSRVPRGTPAGGQFAATIGRTADIQLAEVPTATSPLPGPSFEDRLQERAADDDNWTFPPARNVSTSTPWGTADSAYTYAPGIICYSTPGHGGFHLSTTRNQQVAAGIRQADGWYEEDCDWAAVACTFPEHFPKRHVSTAVRMLKDYKPDGWTAVTGEPLSADESHALREREFHDRHRHDQVAVAAAGDWHSSVPTGMVAVTTCTGGRGTHDRSPARCFLVPSAEYEARSQFGFVVDPSRHTEIQPL